MPCGFEAGLPGDGSKAEESKEGNVFIKLNGAPGDSGCIRWTLGLIQLFPCDMRESSVPGEHLNPQPSNANPKPQVSSQPRASQKRVFRVS